MINAHKERVIKYDYWPQEESYYNNDSWTQKENY